MLSQGEKRYLKKGQCINLVSASFHSCSLLNCVATYFLSYVMKEISSEVCVPSVCFRNHLHFFSWEYLNFNYKGKYFIGNEEGKEKSPSSPLKLLYFSWLKSFFYLIVEVSCFGKQVLRVSFFQIKFRI